MFIKLSSGGLFALLSAMVISSCGIKKSNDTDVQQKNIPVDSKLGLSLNSPKSIIYAHNEMAMTFSNIALLKESLPNIVSSGSKLYTSTGDGGLGADLDDSDTLTAFSGIPIKVNLENIDEKTVEYKLISSGDIGCDKLFSIDQPNGQILVDQSQVNSLMSCHLKITASGLNKETKSKITDEKETDLALNPTLAMYAMNNDPAFSYLQDYSSLKDIKVIAKWLKDSTAQASGLKLAYDPSIIKDKKKLFNINALTGAQNITSIDLSKTDLKDLKALLYFQNLQKVNLSGTKLEPQNISLLGQIKTLKSLDVSNIDIKDIKVITDNVKSLTELNISGNTNISDLEDIANMENLKVLKASSIGLTSFKRLNSITQLNSLDISENDFSKSSDTDIQSLVNLYNLEELNISKSHLPDALLNKYFNNISSRGTLKKFVDANFYPRTLSNTEEECAYRVNNFAEIPYISEVNSLEYVDIHGNGCNYIEGDKQVGIRNASYFSSNRMPMLKYLDISDTTIRDLSDLAHYSHITELHIVHHPIGNGKFIDEGGISMTKDGCLFQLGEHNPLNSECDLLGGGSQVIETFTSPGNYEFNVPNNVVSISITACSAGDGGSGGQGGQGGWSSLYNFYRTGQGWKNYGANCSGKYCEGGMSYYEVSDMPGAGSAGGQGGISGISGIYLTDQEQASQAYSGYCGGGSPGGGGHSGGINTGFWGKPKPPYEPRNGTSGSYGANKKVYTVGNISVTPGQRLTVIVGNGGAGGEGSGPAQNGGCGSSDAGKSGGDRGIWCGWNGDKGGRGGDGSSGYVKITYNIFQGS